MRRLLTDTDIHSLLEKAERGVGPSQLAKDFGISRQSVQYQLRKNNIHLTPFYSGPPTGQTLYLTGTFWLYYNTNRGRPRIGVTERPAPWVLRIISDRKAYRASYNPELAPNQLPEGEEMLVNEVKLVNGSALTRYEPNPIWINKRGDHIRYVRGFLVIRGVIEVKT